MKRILGLMAVAGMFATAAQAQVNSFTLNDGLFRYSVGTTNGGASARTGTTGGSSANFGLASGAGTGVTGDYLWQNHFWYRSAGDTREFALSNMTTSTAVGGNTILNRYVEPIGGSSTANGTLTFDLIYTLNQITTTSAALTINWSVTNNSNSSQTMSFFSYADSDIVSASNDSGTYTAGSGVNFYRNDDTAAGNGSFFTMASDLRLNTNWNIGPFNTPATAAPLQLLGNTAFNDLTNIDSVMGAADNAGALQWKDLVIDAGSTVGGRITLGYNYVVPTPAAAALLGLGGLAALRRRR